MGDELDWDDLRYFLRAVEQKTLAGAARAMGVEHTTIGRRLSALERSLGAPLVLRGPDGLRLTPLGERVVPLAREVERVVASVRELVSSQRTRVRLAVPTGFTKLFTDRLGALREKHPELSLELVSGARPVDLAKSEADLAIRIGTVRDESLVAKKLVESGWALYAAESYIARRGAPMSLDDLAGHDVVGFDPSLASVPPAVWLEARAENATVVVRSREATDMLTAALSGAGLAALPCLLADAEPTLRRLTPEPIASPLVSLVYRREARLSDEVRAVVAFVADVMREEAPRIRGDQR